MASQQGPLGINLIMEPVQKIIITNLKVCGYQKCPCESMKKVDSWKFLGLVIIDLFPI